MITCNRCYLQYVGEKSQKLNVQKCGFIHRKYGDCRVLSQHFNKGTCNRAFFKVLIIEKIEEIGRTNSGIMDPLITQIKKSRENNWMKTLRAAYPYRLNDQVGND